MLNHVYTIIGIVSIMLVIFGYGYKQGRDSMIDKITAQKLDYAQKIIQTERDYQNEQNRIVADYLQQIHEMGEMYENEKIKAENLRDTITVKHDCVSDSKTSDRRVPEKTGNKSGVKCYTEDELLRKIKSSLDIAGECDELAVKYNALLKVCGE